MRHVQQEELSAYIDGEARNPDAVTRHLQECAECAKRHADMARLSGHMRGMGATDVSPAFTTRVLAAAAEAGAPRASYWRWAWAAPAVALVAAAVAAGAFYWAKPVPEPPAVATRPDAGALENVDPDRLMGIIAGRIARGEDPGLNEPGMAPWVDAVQPVDDPESELATLAQADWFQDLAVAVESDADLDVLLSSMTQREVAVMRQLLTQYASEG